MSWRQNPVKAGFELLIVGPTTAELDRKNEETNTRLSG
jgi:hypothetical protein